MTPWFERLCQPRWLSSAFMQMPNGPRGMKFCRSQPIRGGLESRCKKCVRLSFDRCWLLAQVGPRPYLA